MAERNNAAEQSARLSVTQTTTADTRILLLSGEIDADTADLLRQALRIGTGPARAVLDFSAVTFMDSTGINVLVTAHHAAHAADGWIRMAALPASVQRVVEIVGLDTIVPCYPTLPEALTD
ncbi:STAS domain-containing protein [Streptomyces fructofermentans]|uniref:STAS domain-containing protein n=1 Tax=Streptomyces fructofermentans TaxID=152141 RepID=UPI0037AC2701